MKAINVSEATPLQLNWLVAKCEGRNAVVSPHTSLGKIVGYGVYLDPPERDEFGSVEFDPCHDWAQGGPIIERELIGVYPAQRDDKDGMWAARPNYKVHYLFPHLYGPTPLIAAMRCFVVSKLGDVVEVPKKLA